jgi:hypothetical protein
MTALSKVEEVAIKELVKECMAEFLREHLVINIDRYQCNDPEDHSVDIIVKVLLGDEVLSEDAITIS